MEFEVLDNIKVRGKIYGKGDTVTMDKKQVAEEKLVEKGILAEEPEKKEKEPEEEPEKEMFQCPYCEREFTSQRGLAIHKNACDQAPETDE